MKNKKYLNDMMLIVVILVITLAAYIFYRNLGSEGDLVVVKLGNETIGTYRLDVDGEYLLNNGSNTLVIENGKAYMLDADCPDKLCVSQGKISKANQCITCLPNRITVRVVSDNKEVDLVS